MTADVPVVEVVAVDAVLDALDTPTSSEVYSAVEPFSNSAVAAAAAARAIAGGGGGSQPIVSGIGSPVGTVTPTADKPLYIDTDNGAVYLAGGPTNLNWIAVGPVDGNVGEATGFIVNVGNGRLYVLTNDRDEAGPREGYFGDAWSMWNGSGQGLYWSAGPGEGEESLVVKTGTGAAHTGTLQDKDGNMTVPGTLTAGGLAFNGDIDLNGNDLAEVAEVRGNGGGLLAFDGTGSVNISATAGDGLSLSVADADLIGLTDVGGGAIGFFAHSPVPQPTGVAVTAEAIHAALVELGLIAA